MKIAAIADIHIGIKSYGKIDPVTHFNTRELHGLGNFMKVIDYCIDNSIKVLVIAGDTYHAAVSSPTLQAEVNKIIKHATDNDIRCLILDGNHDVGKLDTACSALKPLDTFSVDNVIHTKDFKDVRITIDNESIRFIFLPTYHTNDDIKAIMDSIEYDGTPIICIGHMTVQGAALNDWLVGENESYVDLNCFKKDGIKAVILGHLHKPQELCASPYIFYTGSLQRLDFNEELQPKGFTILDISNDELKHEFHELDSQRFLTVKIDMNDIGNKTVKDYVLSKINMKKAQDSIVRIQLDTTEDNKLTYQDEKDIYEALQSADTVLPIQQKFSDNERARNIELNESVSIEQGLELYYKDKPRAKERIKLGKNIINGVTA